MGNGTGLGDAERATRDLRSQSDSERKQGFDLHINEALVTPPPVCWILAFSQHNQLSRLCEAEHNKHHLSLCVSSEITSDLSCERWVTSVVGRDCVWSGKIRQESVYRCGSGPGLIPYKRIVCLCSGTSPCISCGCLRVEGAGWPSQWLQTGDYKGL